MIDLHCHILWGVDDGSTCLNESIAMAQIAASDGVGTIVATPHIQNQSPSRENIDVLLKGLNVSLKIRGIPVKVLAGGELPALSDPATAGVYAINGSSYVLLEFPHTHMPLNASQIIFNLLANGYKPIIAHPERNPSVVEDPGLLAKLMQENVYAQITACSLTGTLGSRIRKCAQHLVKEGLAHFIASDSHSPTFRAPKLSDGLGVAEEIIGKDAAARLVNDNPRAVIDNEAIGD